MNRGRPEQSGAIRSRSRSRSVTGSTFRTHDENGTVIDDGPIETFISTINSLPDDEWQARTQCFETLLTTLPKDRASIPTNGVIPWYQSYTALRRLSNPIGSLLLNARSSVVKHSTQNLAVLVESVKDLNPPNSDCCKYLLKDLLPAILALHAQTVTVIRTYVFDMMVNIIPLCRFKSGLPILLERLRKDKSRDVREACIQYLHLIVKCWSTSSDGIEYLTENICQHLGNGIARALLDPAQEVRTEARQAFELFRLKYPILWNEIMQKKDGILSKDSRLKKSIMNAAIRADMEGNDNYSYDEGHDRDTMTVGSGGSKTSINSWNSKTSFRSKSSVGQSTKLGFRASQTKTESLNNHPRSSNGIRGPPVRMPAGSNKGTSNSSGPSSSTSPFGTAAISPQRSEVKSIPREVSRREPLDNYESSSTSLTRTSTAESIQSRKPNENYRIANQLLSAHKSYIDELMESLRNEMNTVRNFESLLVKSQNNPKSDGTYGPTDDEILVYFQDVYSYLDKGASNCSNLRKEMERISNLDAN